jgi:hypothetical protein
MYRPIHTLQELELVRQAAKITHHVKENGIGKKCLRFGSIDGHCRFGRVCVTIEENLQLSLEDVYGV